MLLALVFGMSFLSVQARPDRCEIPGVMGPSGENSDNSSMIAIQGYEFQGEFLIINYTIQYPGMTKVKLFDNSKQLLWRSQYVNDKEGKHRLVLRRNVLSSGMYHFEFDYKNQKRILNVSI